MAVCTDTTAPGFWGVEGGGSGWRSGGTNHVSEKRSSAIATKIIKILFAPFRELRNIKGDLHQHAVASAEKYMSRTCHVYAGKVICRIGAGAERYAMQRCTPAKNCFRSSFAIRYFRTLFSNCNYPRLNDFRKNFIFKSV